MAEQEQGYQYTVDELENLEERARMGGFFQAEAERFADALYKLDPDHHLLRSEPWKTRFEEKAKGGAALARGEDPGRGTSPDTVALRNAVGGEVEITPPS